MSRALSLDGGWDLYPILAQETKAKGVQMINYYFSSEIVSENEKDPPATGNHHRYEVIFLLQYQLLQLRLTLGYTTHGFTVGRKSAFHQQ